MGGPTGLEKNLETVFVDGKMELALLVFAYKYSVKFFYGTMMVGDGESMQS